jgi:inosose dehydratase
LEHISEAGYEGFELFDGNLMQYENRNEEFKRLMEIHSLQFIGVYSGGNFIYNEILDEELFKIERVAKFAAEMGAVHLVVGGGAVRSNGILETDYELLGRALDKVVDISIKHSLIPSFHPHLGTIAQNPEQLDKIMAFTSINLCPDTAHIEAGGGDPAEVIRKYADRIKYVHLKDYANGTFLPLGQGKQNLSEVMSTLASIQYDGWLTVELDSFKNYLKEKL